MRGSKNKIVQIDNKTPLNESENKIIGKKTQKENKVQKNEKIIQIDIKKKKINKQKKKAKKAYEAAELASKEANILRLKAIEEASLAKQYEQINVH